MKWDNYKLFLSENFSSMDYDDIREIMLTGKKENRIGNEEIKKINSSWSPISIPNRDDK